MNLRLDGAQGAAGVTLLSAVLGFLHLTAQPLWNDEAFSFFVANHELAGVFAFMRQDTQPPLYYMVLSEWLTFGHDPFVMRSLSVVAIVASVPLLYDAGRRLLGTPVALLAALIFTCDPSVLLWEQHARPYALQTAFVALAFWGFARIWVTPRAAPRIAWLAWILGGALALVTQYPAGFFLLGANVAIALRTRLRPNFESGLLWRWCLAQLAMMALWLPWFLPFLAQVAAHLTPTKIAARHALFLVSTSAFVAGLRNLLSISTLWRAQLPFTLLFAGLAIAGATTVRRHSASFLLLGTCAVPLVACVIGFMFVHPLFGYVTFNFIWLLLPYSLLLAVGIMSMPRKWRAAVLVFLLVGDLWGVRNAYAITSPPLDQISDTIRSQLHAGDGIILSQDASARWGLAYYLGPPYIGVMKGLDVSDVPVEGWPIRGASQTREFARLWAVFPENEVPALDLLTLAPDFQVAFEHNYGGIEVRRYDRLRSAM